MLRCSRVRVFVAFKDVGWGLAEEPVEVPPKSYSTVFPYARECCDEDLDAAVVKTSDGSGRVMQAAFPLFSFTFPFPKKKKKKERKSQRQGLENVPAFFVLPCDHHAVDTNKGYGEKSPDALSAIRGFGSNS